METRVDEIADGIYRLSTFLPEVAGGMSFNQFLVDAEEPLLFHCGHRGLFPLVSKAAAGVVALDRLRWVSFSHVEADECGALDGWLAAAPQAIAVQGRLACNVWLNDMAPRPPRALADDEVLDLGGRRVRRLDTPHLPHNWEAGLLYEETTGTLFCSDLFSQFGDGPALTGEDIVAPAVELEKAFHFVPPTPHTGPMLRRLAGLRPRTLAVMHGASYEGDGAAALERLAAFYEAEASA
jgi:flavorubredoxin